MSGDEGVRRVVRVLCARCNRGIAQVHLDGGAVLTDWRHRAIPLVEQSTTVVILCRNELHGERELLISEIVKATRRAAEKNRVQVLRA